MIDLTSALSPASSPLAAAPAPAAAASAGPGAPPGRFGQTLEAFLDAHDPTIDAPGLLPAAVGRQGLADDGKDTPSASKDDDDASEDDGDATAAPIWLPTALLPLVPPPPQPAVTAAANAVTLAASSVATPSVPTPNASTPNASTMDVASAMPPVSPQPSLPPVADADAAPAPPPPPPNVGTPPALPAGAPASVAAPPAAVSAVAPAPAASTTPVAPPAPVAAQSVAAVIADVLGRASQASARGDVATRAVPTDSLPSTTAQIAPAGPAITVSATPQPAGQIFAAAIAAAASWRDRDTRTTKQDSTDATAQLGVANPLQAADRAVVHATGDAGGAALDLTQDTGLHRMIDHIETLRDTAGDAADARDTRIRLVPDALGSVDVSVRQDGDRVHVSFTAEHDATRTLIADAQPRLTELAAERGVRIGDTSVATNGGGNATPQQPRPTPQIARAPVPAATETETPSDDRVA